ncbi:MAG: ABC transporter permease subunit [Planctomycetota bacterium]
MEAAALDRRIAELRRARPRDRFVRASLGLLALGLGASWLVHRFSFADFTSPRRVENFERFLTEIRPRPLRDRAWDWEIWRSWAGEVMTATGWESAAGTLGISVLAIAIAGIFGYLLAILAARTVCSPEPWLREPCPPSPIRRAAWRTLFLGARLVLILMRALPEYLIAFLFVSFIAGSAWPGVVALAIHNAGILGRLGSESIENLPPRTLRGLRGIGARRRQIAALGVLPVALPRLLLYFFYRWESCVREATVLGSLGFASLGFAIADSRIRGRYDQLVFLIGVGAVIVLVGDLISAFARRLVR